MILIPQVMGLLGPLGTIDLSTSYNLSFSLFLLDECGRSSQRGQPQHAGDEQSRDMAHLPATDRRVAHRPAQHSLFHRAARLDPYQCDPQPGQFKGCTNSKN